MDFIAAFIGAWLGASSRRPRKPSLWHRIWHAPLGTQQAWVPADHPEWRQPPPPPSPTTVEHWIGR